MRANKSLYCHSDLGYSDDHNSVISSTEKVVSKINSNTFLRLYIYEIKAFFSLLFSSSTLMEKLITGNSVQIVMKTLV